MSAPPSPMANHVAESRASGTSPPEPAYLTPAQVAALLQISVKTVYRWSSTDSTMPVLRVGSTVRFPRERLLRWLRDREQGGRRALATAS